MTERELPLSTRRASKLLARAIQRGLAPGDLVVFSGPLGAGKTFIVRAICRELGLDPKVRVTSPTFTLVHEYATTPPIVHADLYRLKLQEEVDSLGLLEQRDDGKILLVEWGEAFIDQLGGDALVVELDVSPRSAHLRATGPHSSERLHALGETT
jgi:tRNA threonylcarbamoyladenosine biosynthesis protein TsaE